MANDAVVFKMSYKSKNDPKTRGLNLRHLEYIATRPGVMKNPNCGFGAFGQIDKMRSSGMIYDLRLAQKEISDVSKTCTIYRAILSVNKDTAQNSNLYDREEWEKLLRSNIGVIAEEMHIKRSDLRWVVSVHYKKHHPHVHLMFWDKSEEPRREYIPKERFDKMSEHIRSVFTAKLVHGVELKNLNIEKDNTVKEARLRLSSLLREANVAEALNLDHVSVEKCDELGRELLELATHLPSKGALKYEYLPVEYKAKLDAYIERVMKITDFEKLGRKYEKITANVSSLYGNKPEEASNYQKSAHKSLMRELGNETLQYLREVADELKQRAPPVSGVPELLSITRSAVVSVLQNNTQYSELLKMMPKHRTPRSVILNDSVFAERLNKLTNDLCSDIRIRSKVDAYLDTVGASKQEGRTIYRDLWRTIRDEIMNQLGGNAGYDHDANVSIGVTGLLALFRMLSQSTNQKQSQSDLYMTKYRNLSETAKRDRRKLLEQHGAWDLE